MAKNILDIDAGFFEKYAAVDPGDAWLEWTGYLGSRRRRSNDDSMRRKVLQVCTGLSASAVRHYLTRRHQFLGESSLDALDLARKGLGLEPVPRAELPPEAMAAPRRTNCLALLTQLQVPSESYHLELIRSMVRNGQLHHLAVSVHEVSPLDLGSSIERVRAAFRPDGIVLLRLTPSSEDLKRLERMNTPIVLVHADRYRYPKPVVANVIPNQEHIEQDLRSWIDRYLPSPTPARTLKSRAMRKAVLITMPMESPCSDLPPIAPGIDPSIRNDRIARLVRALRDFRLPPAPEGEVPDYRFRHAVDVYQRHGDADLFVSLSDQIAVGLKHLLIAAGKPWRHRIVGFDDSPLAKEEQLASFSQSLDRIGFVVVDQLCRLRRSGTLNWPEFQELPTGVHLEMRCTTES